jgi:SAM-dependent MidA family methyltransferase
MPGNITRLWLVTFPGYWPPTAGPMSLLYMRDSTLGPSNLATLIRDHIRRYGPVHFTWYMEQALYHPEFGYYTSPRLRIGRRGDYYTNVSVGSLYGQLLASQLVEMWTLLGTPACFTVVEQGAEEGRLALDILSAIKQESIGTAEAVHYIILEPVPGKRQQQRAILEGPFFGKVTWLTGLNELEGVTGAFISNELVDAMPVYLVEYRNGVWSELLVDISEDGFCFRPSKIESSELAKSLEKLPSFAISPYRTEVNLAAKRWIRDVSRSLERGFVLIVDYGFPRREYYKPQRNEGTLSCYSLHRRSYDPLVTPGEIDITAHVEFTSLAEAAEEASLKVAGYTDQHHFMVGAAESRLLALEKMVETAGLTSIDAAFFAQYRTLMHPGTMGMAFKYLLLAKGIDGLPQLSGFKYAGPPWQSLA